MFPTLRNRLLIAGTLLMGAWVWVSALSALRTGDGTDSPTLITAHGGVAAALLAVVVAGIPAIALSIVCAAGGNPLSGVFAVTTCLWMMAANGESIEPWLRRDGGSLPADYYKLIVEMILWAILVTGFIVLSHTLRPALQKKVPMLAREHHLGEGTTVAMPDVPTLASAAIAAVFAGVLAFFLLRHAAVGQVVGALMAAFLVGTMTGDLACSFLLAKRPTNAVRVVLAPVIVAVVAYLMAAMGYSDREQFLQALFSGKLPGLALALPIHYAGAGIAGACLGAGAAQVILAGDKAEKKVAAPLATPVILAGKTSSPTADKSNG